MALSKTENYKGQDASYWRIIHSTPNYDSNETFVTLALYFSREARLASPANILSTISFFVNGVDLTRDDVYAALKNGTVLNDVSREPSDVFISAENV